MTSEKLKIMLDPGHGGRDPGAVAVIEGRILRESEFNFEIVRHMKRMIEEGAWATVDATSSSLDETLTPGEAFRKFVKSQADILVSVHCNSSSNPRATGIEVVYRDAQDYPLADEIYKHLVFSAGLRGRGVKNDIDDLGRKLAMLSSVSKPCCLVEVGFISNPGDVKVFSNTMRIAEAIVLGIYSWNQKHFQRLDESRA